MGPCQPCYCGFRGHQSLSRTYLGLVLSCSGHLVFFTCSLWSSSTDFFYLHQFSTSFVSSSTWSLLHYFLRMDCACLTNFLHGLLARSGVIVKESDNSFSQYQTDELNWTEVSIAKWHRQTDTDRLPDTVHVVQYSHACQRSEVNLSGVVYCLDLTAAVGHSSEN